MTRTEPWDAPASRRGLADVLREEEAEREAERRRRGETSVGVSDGCPCARCGASVPEKGAVQDGTWRLHPGCTDDTRVLRVLTGDRRVTPDEAEAVWRDVRGVPEYRRARGALPGMPSSQRRPLKAMPAWEFLGENDRDMLRAALAVVRTPPKVRQPRRSRLGACGWCGRARSFTWHKVPGWMWPDGAPAVLCSACVQGWRAAGRPSKLDADRWPGHALALMVGAVEPMADWSGRFGCSVYVDAPGADRGGVEAPWSWVPRQVLHEAKVRTLGAWPNLALDAADGAVYRAEYRRRTRQAEAQRRAKEEAARPIRW